MKEEKFGFVSNYFSKLSVSAIEITDGTLSVGDAIRFSKPPLPSGDGILISLSNFGRNYLL